MAASSEGAWKTFELPSGFRHLTDGKLEASDTSFPVINPLMAESFAECPEATRASLDRAVTTVPLAFRFWRQPGFDERKALLHRFADALRDAADELVPLLTREQVKSLAEARDEIRRAVETVYEVCTIAIEPEVLQNDAKSRVELHYRSLGVGVGITPWSCRSFLPHLKYGFGSLCRERANATRCSLGGPVWTKNVACGAEIAGLLEAGVTWVNRHVGLPRDMPFGGIKESGVGRQDNVIGAKGDVEPQVAVVPAG